MKATPFYLKLKLPTTSSRARSASADQLIYLSISFPFQIDVLMGEPFFSSTLQPWHDLHFWYAKDSLGHLLASDCTILPRSGTLKAMALQFNDLWKFHAPVVEKEGFNLAEFDVIVQVWKMCTYYYY